MNTKCHTQSCALCTRSLPLTFHHLIPRTCHSNKWFRKRFSTQEMRERGIWVCRLCHSFIHRQYTEKDLGRRLNTLEVLMSDPAILRHCEWAQKQR